MYTGKNDPKHNSVTTQLIPMSKWELPKNQSLGKGKTTYLRAPDLSMSSDGKRIVTMENEGVRIFDVESQVTYCYPSDPVVNLFCHRQMSPSFEYCVAVSSNKLSVWKLSNCEFTALSSRGLKNSIPVNSQVKLEVSDQFIVVHVKDEPTIIEIYSIPTLLFISCIKHREISLLKHMKLHQDRLIYVTWELYDQGNPQTGKFEQYYRQFFDGIPTPFDNVEDELGMLRDKVLYGNISQIFLDYRDPVPKRFVGVVNGEFEQELYIGFTRLNGDEDEFQARKENFKPGTIFKKPQGMSLNFIREILWVADDLICLQIPRCIVVCKIDYDTQSITECVYLMTMDEIISFVFHEGAITAVSMCLRSGDMEEDNRNCKSLIRYYKWDISKNIGKTMNGITMEPIMQNAVSAQ